MPNIKKALILLVHGSKDPAWMEPFEKLRDDVAARSPGVRVEIACLQFRGPDVKEAVSGLAEEGVREIVIVPVFISALGHVLKDVPVAVEEAEKKFPNLKVTVTEALGETPEVMKSMREALARVAGEA
jgi:sirohydrochlorin cobaltochelatase